MIAKHLLRFCLMVLVLGMTHPLLAENDDLPNATIELEKNIHFMTPNDEDVIVPQGFYTVEAVPGGMQLIEGITAHEAGEIFLIRAKLRPYEEKMEAPQAQSMPLDEDIHYLALVLPDGQILESIGSYSGVRSRGNTIADIIREAVPPHLRPLTEEEKDLIARRDALLSARRKLALEKLARDKEQAAKNPSEWKDYCSKRYPNHVNNHNNCCVQKYDTCLRSAKTFKDSARRGFEQTCQALNGGCWIKRKTANLDWMRNYCDSSGNLKKIRVSNKKKCCSKMYNRCYKASLSVPTVSGRQESQGNCKEAREICQSSP